MRCGVFSWEKRSHVAVKESWRDERELSLVRSERQSFVQNEKNNAQACDVLLHCNYIAKTNNFSKEGHSLLLN